MLAILSFDGVSVRTSQQIFRVPGASLGSVTAEMADKTTLDTLFVILTGTRDVRSTRSDEVRREYQIIIRCCKTKSPNNYLHVVQGIQTR